MRVGADCAYDPIIFAHNFAPGMVATCVRKLTVKFCEFCVLGWTSGLDALLWCKGLYVSWNIALRFVYVMRQKYGRCNGCSAVEP
jgi:hypothetical protein